VASLAGFTVVLLFITFAAQVLLGLYATSTVRATLHDAASRAADQRTSRPDLAGLAAQAEASLGEMGDRTTITLELLDEDGDGTADVVVGRASAVPPRVVPPSIGGTIGFDRIDVAVRVRIERVR
jgi:putative Ca2+/H+ antiporter (TMEM165/GDT1 family)